MCLFLLISGQVGYVVCGIKDPKDVNIGDTLHHTDHPVDALQGFKKSKPVVFGCLFPSSQSEYPRLRKALNYLALNDQSIVVEGTKSAVLGKKHCAIISGLIST